MVPSDAFTNDVPPFGLFIEQLELFLVTTSNCGVSIVFYTLKQKQFNFYIVFACLKSADRLRTRVT